MRARIFGCLALALAAGALAIAPAPAAGQGVVLATSNHYYPGDQREVGAGGAVPMLSVVEGSSLLFLNAEGNFESHTLTSDDVDPVAGLSLFDSGFVDARTSGDVAGVAELAPGVYRFHCLIPYHNMFGYLNVVALPGG